MTTPQVHYLLGWIIVVSGHNWPAFAAGLLTATTALWAWIKPSRRSNAALYGAALLLVDYEYAKHIGPALQDAANYLLMFELLPLNRVVWLLVGPVAVVAVLGLAVAFWLYALLQWCRIRISIHKAP